MTNGPADCLFHKEHLWVRRLEGDEALVGITDHARISLKKIVYVDCPKPGTQLVQGVPFGVIESTKVVSDLHAPASGTVIESNTRLKKEVSLINNDPHGEGWITRIKLTRPAELSGLMTADQYLQHVGKKA